jgi:DNA-binding transcriptional MerR regulator
MRIKELSVATSVPVDTIRHYEKAGLLSAPERQQNNYRHYAEADMQRLRLDEVRVLLAFIDHPASDCSPVDAVVDEHLLHVRERLAALQVLERQLETLRRACGQARPHATCGIVLALSNDPPPPNALARSGVHGR